MKKKKDLRMMIGLIMLVVLGVSIGSPVLALDNTGTVGSGTVSTTDAFYYSDQYMWKVSLFVAKADTVNRADATMADFHRIGSEAVYLSPVADWSGWVGGARPKQLSSLEFTKGNKIDTLQELKNNGGDVNALDPVVFTNSGGVNMIPGVPDLPFPPQMCDGIINDNGVVYSEYVGNLTEVTDYFGKGNTMYNLLVYYANQQGKTPQDLVSELEFTINGETRTGWNAEGILPKEINGNPTNQVEWLIVYEPCTIVYTRDTASWKPSDQWYKGYVMTATDFAVTQLKHQMDWRYDETRMSSWAGNQPDAWLPNDQRQHVARLSHLVVGNSVIIKEGWYGLDASGNKVDQNAAPPYSRWTSENELKYGGWGMSLWEKPKTTDKPIDYDFNADTDVIYATDIFSNIDTLPGQELTVKYEINGETFSDTVVVPKKTKALSYFKWHTPDVDTVTTYDLKISVSPFPKGTVDGDGNEYVSRKITVRPLSEQTPNDPKVHDKLPEDFVVGSPPGSITGDDTIKETDKPEIISISEKSDSPYYVNDVVSLEVVTNRVTKWIDFKNTQSGDLRQLTAQSIGNGVLVSMFENKLNDTITWKIEFTMAQIGNNVYAFTPGNSDKGLGNEKLLNLELSEEPDIPVIFSVDINPKPSEEPGFYYLYTNTKSPELEYLVIYNTDGGTRMEPVKVKAKALLTKPTDPIKEGYDFVGWYKDNNYSSPWDWANDRINGVTTIYAKWDSQKFTVSFNNNGKGTEIMPITVEYGKNVVEPVKPMQEGFRFEGWYTDNTFNKKWDFDNDTVINDVNLFAKWSPNKLLVDFQENGGLMVEDRLVDYDSLISEPVSLRNGYLFEGWFADKDCTVSWDFSTNRIKANTFIYAKWKAKPSVIEFIENSGDAVTDLIGVTDQIINDRSMPVTQRAGYTLEGWFENEDLTGVVVTQLPEKYPADGIKYYAKWSAKPSVIEFIENSGDAVPDLTGVTDQVITDRSMPVAQRTGYTLEGWFENEDLIGDAITQLPEKYPVDGIKYYAKWKAKPSIIEFIENSGDAVADLTGVTDQVITDRSMPVAQRTGYTLEGWFENADLTGVAVTQLPEKYPADGIKYYAKWSAKPSVIEFIENSGDAVPDLTGVTDQIITDRSMPVTQRAGYTLEGWFENADLTGVAVTQLPEKYPADGIKYYAKWSAKPSVIEFIENSGDAVPDLTGVTDQIITDRSMPVAQRAGYTLEGWFENADLTGFAVTQLPEKYPADGIKYYAKWKAKPSIIEFIENSGDAVPDLTGVTDQVITDRSMPVAQRTGYTLEGWFENEDLTGVAVTQLPEKYPADGVKYYAKWKIKILVVSFDSQGGSAVPQTTTNYNTLITAPTTPVKPGYTYNGWYKDPACTQVWTWASDRVVNDMTLYAKWKINYTVTFDSQGGSAITSLTVQENETFYADSLCPVRSGYTFYGWFKESSCINEWTYLQDKVTQNTTLYAKWVANYIVSFDSQGGTLVSSKSISPNMAITEPASPTKDGYTFVGWYREPAGISAWNFAYSVPSNMTLYAKWEPTVMINVYYLAKCYGYGDIVQKTIQIPKGTAAPPYTDPFLFNSVWYLNEPGVYDHSTLYSGMRLYSDTYLFPKDSLSYRNY